MNIGFIGAGKAGIALGRYLADHGNTVIGYASRTTQSACEAAAITQTRSFGNCLELAQASDLLFITTPDGAISTVWQELYRAHHQGILSLSQKIIAHISGATSSEIFLHAEAVQALPCSAHPLLAFGNKENAHIQLAQAHFALEGNERAVTDVEAILNKAGNTVHRIKAADKTRYHAAAVFASNLVLAPLDRAARILENCGFSSDDAREALEPLIRGNVENFCRQGAVASLTGPVERADEATVRSHLDCLNKSERALYCALSRSLVAIAQQKHPDRDYRDWDVLLCNDESIHHER